MLLLEMRDRWKEALAAHLTEERRERMAVAWARLRLMDLYEPEFVKQKRTLNSGSSLSDRRASAGSFGGREDADQGGREYDLFVEKPRMLTDLDVKDIRAMVTTLPERQARIVSLIVFEGYTQHEVAAMLGISQPAVSSGYDKAREELKLLLSDYAEKIV